MAVSRAKKTAVIHGSAVDRFGVIAQQIGAALLWIVGLFGSMLVFVPGQLAGFLADRSTLTWKAALGGIAIQLALTAFEFVNRKKKARPYWWIPFAIDVGMSYFGFRTTVVPWMSGHLEALELSTEAAGLMAHTVVLLVSAFAAWLPEDTFID